MDQSVQKRHHRRRLVLVIALVAAAIASVVSSLCGCSVALLTISDAHQYFAPDNAKIVNGMWVHPLISGRRRFFCLPPLIGYQSEGPPYSAGISVVDYDNQNLCTKVEITGLVLIHDGVEHLLVGDGSVVSSDFDQYIEGVLHMKADCVTRMGDAVSPENRSPIVVRAKFSIYTQHGPITESIDATVMPSHNTGCWFISGSFSE
jgi:hypothetical protein